MSRRNAGRRGEKVPTAVGTVAERFVERQLTARDSQRSVRGADGAKSSTVGTGEFGGERLGLMFDKNAEGSLSESRRGRGGDLLHRLEVEDSAWRGVTPGASGDDFSPAGGEVVDCL